MIVNKMMRVARFAATAVLLSSAGCISSSSLLRISKGATGENDPPVLPVQTHAEGLNGTRIINLNNNKYAFRTNNITNPGIVLHTTLSSAGCKINLPEPQHRSHPVQPRDSRPMEEVPVTIKAFGINGTPISELQMEGSDFEPDRPGAMPYQYLFPISESSSSGIKLEVAAPGSAYLGSMVWIGYFRASCDNKEISDISMLKPEINITGPDGKPIKAKTATKKGILQVVLRGLQ